MIKWIASSSALIILIIILRHLLKGKISLRLQYALWGLALLRLLIPFSLGTSSISVENAAQRTEIVRNSEIVSGVSRIEHKPDGSVEGYYSGGLSDDAPAVIAESKTDTEFRRLERALTMRELLIPVWIGGAIIMLIIFLASNLRFTVRLKGNRRRLDADNSSLPVYVTDEADTPCLFGLFSPSVYVTAQVAENKSALSHTMEHELTHYRHRDNWWSFFRVLCICVHWYNPLVWAAAILSRNDAELACDEGTISHMGEEKRLEYGHFLIDMTCEKPASLLLTATTMNSSKGGIKERIKLIAKKPETKLYTLVVVLLIAAFAVGCTFTGAKNKGEPELQKVQEPDAPDGTVSTATDLSDYKEKISSESKSFEPGEIHDLSAAELHFDGLTLTTSDEKNLKWLEDNLSAAEAMKREPDCSFESVLYLIRADGAVFSAYLAGDSCGILLSDDVFYKFGGSNIELRNLFFEELILRAAQEGIDAASELVDMIQEWAISTGESFEKIIPAIINGTEDLGEEYYRRYVEKYKDWIELLEREKPSSETVNLPERLYVPTHSRSSVHLRHDFFVDTPMDFIVSISTEAGSLSLSIIDKDTKEVFFEQEDSPEGLTRHKISLEPGQYSVVINCSEHYGYYEILGKEEEQ